MSSSTQTFAMKPAPVLPTRTTVLQPLQRVVAPTRVLQSTHAPQQLSFQFHR